MIYSYIQPANTFFIFSRVDFSTVFYFSVIISFSNKAAKTVHKT